MTLIYKSFREVDHFRKIFFVVWIAKYLLNLFGLARFSLEILSQQAPTTDSKYLHAQRLVPSLHLFSLISHGSAVELLLFRDFVNLQFLLFSKSNLFCFKIRFLNL